MDIDQQHSIALQLGVLIQTLIVIIRHMGIDPVFRQDLELTLQKFADLQQSQPYSDDTIELVNEMIQTLLIGLAPAK